MTKSVVMALVVSLLSPVGKADTLMNQTTDFIGTFYGFLEQCYEQGVIPRTDIHNKNWKAMEERGVPLIDLAFEQTQWGARGRVFELGSGQWKTYNFDKLTCSFVEREHRKLAISISRN